MVYVATEGVSNCILCPMLIPWGAGAAALLFALLLAYSLHRFFLLPRSLLRQVDVAAAELKEAKERYHLLFDESPCAVILVDPASYRLLEFNAMAIDALGYTREELAGLSMADIEVCDNFLKSMVEANSSRVARFQTQYRHKSGRVVQVAVSACTAAIHGKRVVHCVWRDISEQLDAQHRLAREQALLKALIDSIPDFIFFKDQDSVYLGCNKAYEARAGRPEKDLVGRTDLDFYPPEEAQFYRAKDQEMLAQGRSMQIEEVVQNADGSVNWFDTIKTPFFGPTGEVLGLVGVCRDVTVRKQAEQSLELSDTVFEATAEGILITDAAARIIRVNPAFCAITGYAEPEVLGQNPRLISSGRHDHAFYERMWNDLGQHGRWQGDIWNRRRNGEIYPQWLSIAAVRNSLGDVEQYVGVFSDITQRKRDEEFIRYQASHDALTGLPNRTLFIDRLKRALAHSSRTGCTPALLFVDLDEFKSVNDTLGHEAGDALLCAVARRLGECVREEDTVARLGGDEFTVILSQVDGQNGAAIVAEKIRGALAEPLVLAGEQRIVSASIGIALAGVDGTDASVLLRNADRAMYDAKRAGRNTWRCFCAMIESSN